MKLVLFVSVLCFLLGGTAQLSHAQDSKETQLAESKNSPSATSSTNKEKSNEYLIGTGDTLDVLVERRPELGWRGKVSEDGSISGLPYIKKALNAVCRSEKELASEISDEYREIIRNPTITVRVVERSTRPAYLLGAVRTPQRFQMQRDVRLVELLFLSGGVTDRASGDIQIFTSDPSPCRDSRSEAEQLQDQTQSPLRVIKIMDLMAGVEGANPVVVPGDIITVMAAAPVYLTGGVVSPQGINFRDQLTLTRAIATVGGLSSNARGSEIRIYRRKQGATGQEVIKADYNAIKKQKQTDVQLKPYDIVEVPQSSGLFGQRSWKLGAQEIISEAKSSEALPLRVLN